MLKIVFTNFCLQYKKDVFTLFLLKVNSFLIFIYKKNMIITKTIKDRWNSETPKFFRQIKKLSITLGSSATAVWTINSSMDLGLDDSILQICKYLIAFCAAMGLTAQLTRVDNPDEKLNN